MSPASPLSTEPALKPWPDVAALVKKSIEAGAQPPECEVLWAWKSVMPDLRTYNRYRWPWPGSWVEPVDDGRSWDADGHDCPSIERGGYCLAKTVAGAASGGIPIGTALLLGYRAEDILGESKNKLRVSRAYVLDVVDLRANLARADLARADLARANLAWANLAGANLAMANLYGANLAMADLARADLARANLAGANLAWANLARADLARANLAGANLAMANLARANLARANLYGANLDGAYYDQLTLWPDGFDPAARGAVKL